MKHSHRKLVRNWNHIKKLFYYRIITKEKILTPDTRRVELLIIRRCTPDGKPDNKVYLFGNVIDAFFKLFTKKDNSWQHTALGSHYKAQRVSIPFYISLLKPNSLHAICRNFGIHHIRLVKIGESIKSPDPE